MSKLFQVASRVARKQAKREFSRHPIGRVVREVRRYTSATRGGSRRMGAVLDRLSTPEIRQMIQGLERSGPVVTKYGVKEEAKENLTRVLGLLGPLGDIIRRTVFSPGTAAQTAFDVAVDIVRAFGGEVLTRRGERGYQRGVEAAKQLLSEIATPPPVAPKPAPSAGTAPQSEEDEWPDEMVIQTLGRGSLGYDEDETRRLIEKEIRVSSSNVFSFVFERESVRHGILYVTFLAWTPGGGKRNSPGPTYAYYDVPLSKYQQFKRAATNGSAGSAVWDYLRVRGSVYEHQHQYRLVGATLIQESGEFYIPRKVTAGGFKRRAVPMPGVGRRGYQRSTLPPREFAARAEPNRGRPDRGTPNRGR